MRLRPVLGRSFAATDGAVAILGYDVWQRYYQRSMSALGRTIRVQGKPLTIVGVAPRGYTTIENSGPLEAIVPLPAMAPMDRVRADASSAWNVVGRLAPGVTIEAAQAELDALWARLRLGRKTTVRVQSAEYGTGFNFARRRFSYPLRVLLGMSALLLMVGALNVATLLAARADARHREIGVQLALGAGRGRILRQHGIEGVAIAAIGASLGAVCGRWAIAYFSQFVWTANIERARYVPVDLHVFTFTAGAAAFSGVLFALIPALRALRADPAESLRRTRAAGARLSAGRVLIVSQVAISLVLLVAAALFTTTLRNLRAAPLGFETDRVAGLALMNRPGAYRGMDPFAYYPELFRHVAQIPGVEAVGAASLAPVIPPLLPAIPVSGGRATAAAQEFLAGPGYFETLRIPLLSGREFNFHDDLHSPRAAVVSDTLARRLFPSADPLGQSIRIGGDEARDLVICGVVRDSALGSLQRPNSLQVFTDPYQNPDGGRQPYLLVRTTAAPSAEVLARVRAAVEGLGREYPLRVETMGHAIDRSLSQERLMRSLAAGFGVLALMLAGVGLYGLMSYSVTRRSREIGIRMAVGARPPAVARMIARETLMLLAGGLALGAPGVWAGARVIRGMLYGVAPLDPIALAAASLVLTAAAAVAAYLPARRASRVDPSVALRSE